MKTTKNVKLCAICMLLLVMTGMMLFSACAEFGAFESQGLDAKTERKVLRDCVKYLNKRDKTLSYNMHNTLVGEYYGTYKGSIVVVIYPSFYDSTGENTAAYCFTGILIFNNFDFPLLVWKTGSVYTLPQAWKAGLLTQANIQNVAWKKYGDDCLCDRSMCSSTDASYCSCEKKQGDCCGERKF